MQADGFLLDRGHLCYSQIKICWNGDHDKNQFLKNSMNYRGKKQWFTASEIKKSRDSSLVPDPSPQTSSPSNSPLSRGPRGRPEGRRGGLLGYSEGVHMGRAHTPAPPGLYHIYKHIHKYITYNSGSGRQASHRGSADRSQEF